MKEKIYNILKRIYGVGMMVAFLAGGIPIIPFVFAIIIGGDVGEGIANFLYKRYYPVVIVLAAIACLVGLVAVYIGKKHDFVIKKSHKAEK